MRWKVYIKRVTLIFKEGRHLPEFASLLDAIYKGECSYTTPRRAKEEAVKGVVLP
jgi:hypothetical protein